VRRIAQAFRLYGWISFWLQLVLAVVSAGILLVPAVTQGGETSNPGTSTGLFLAGGGVIALFAGAFWAFRYTRMARRLQYASPDNRPKPKDAMQAIRIGLIIGLVGMLLTLLGAEAIVGSLFVKSLSQLGAGIALDPSRYIQPLDIFVVQAYTHTVVAHFAGIMTALLLFRTVNR
jgi:hypothetical protein